MIKIDGRINNIFSKIYPDLLQYWDYENNIEKPNEIGAKSKKKVHWKCYKCNFEYVLGIDYMVKRELKNKCLNCVIKKPININNAIFNIEPELFYEWNFYLNEELDPYKISFGSNKKAWWICSKCKSNYYTSVKNRSGNNKRGCPYCRGFLVNETNSLKSIYPEIAAKLINCDGSNITPYSNKIIKFKCNKCGEILNSCPAMLVRSFLNNSNNIGCKFCTNQAINTKNNLTVTNSELLSIWNYDKNELGPENYCATSGKPVWWKCGCGNEFISKIYKKLNNLKCKNCKARNTSTTEQEWIKSLNISTIQHHVHININSKRFYFDAYDPITNTVYEFNGDFWHGNPEIYEAEDVNKVNKKTFGELYQNTVLKMQMIKNAGFNIISIWEKDYLKLKKDNK